MYALLGMSAQSGMLLVGLGAICALGLMVGLAVGAHGPTAEEDD